MIRLSIRRPVAVAMIYASVAALGAFAWRNIPIELLPDTQLPRLGIQASWPGASPETVEAFLTSPLEATVQQVPGVERVTSRSHDLQGTGQASIAVEFARSTEMDFARLDLSERIATLEETLPPGVGTVRVQPYVPEAFRDQQRPFLTYTLSGPYTLEALRAHVDERVRRSITEVEGVGQVVVLGGRRRRLEILVDPEASRSLRIPPAELQRKIEGLDLVGEVGMVREGAREWAVTIVNRPAAAADVLDAVVASVGGRPVRVRDIATLSDTYEEAREYRRIDGEPAVTFSVLKEVGTNTVAVADRVKARMARLEALAPIGARYVLVDDESADIRRQLSDLRTRAILSALVVFVVLLAFLRSFRSAGLVFATIAFSVLIAFNLIYFSGLSLNLLTLMGLAMGFGLVVDNSIVVLENVHRHRQAGASPATAAEAGTREVVVPILASTATTLIVFVPFVWLQGELRAYYLPLAVVVGLTLLASLFVAFTFVPAVAARVFAARVERPAYGAGERSGRMASLGVVVAGASGPVPIYVRPYAALVRAALRHPWVAVALTVGLFAGSGWLFDRDVTRGRRWGGWGEQTYIQVNVTLPRGSDLGRTDELVRFFEARIAAMPEVERFTSRVTGTSGTIEVTFPDSLEATLVPVAIKDRMMAYSHGFTGAEVRVYGFGPSFYGGGGMAPNYAIRVLGYNYEAVRDIAESLGARLARMARVDEVETNASGRFTLDRATEYVAQVDRGALARWGLTTADLVGTLATSVGGSAGVGRLELGSDEVELQVKLVGSEAADVRTLLGTPVPLPGGGQVRLGDVVRVLPRDVLANIVRENQQYERRVAYEFRGPVQLGDAVRDAVLARTELPPGYRVEPDVFRFAPDEQRQILGVLLLSVLLVYMVTAAVFESLRQPLCVLLTVPMAMVGVFLIFVATGATFTREAYIGVILAGGIVANNAILLVDHVNRVRRLPGIAFQDAVLRGTVERVRPILMTSATTVLGLLPLVLLSAADANIWNALGLTLIGGLLSSTVLVLTVTPALYLLLLARSPSMCACSSAPSSSGGA